MTKGIIYYTDNRLKEPIFSVVQKQILQANLPIVSVSQSPINFGKNFVMPLKPSYIAMIKQISKALEESNSDIVFFCEHDVLYPLSHFDFTPPKNDVFSTRKRDVFYYNSNVWRWAYPTDLLITYDRLISLSGLCCNRELALKHYRARLKKIEELQVDEDVRLHEPAWARRWGYEPGTKKTKRGGFSDDDFETWRSEVPMIDIRHGRTFSQSKVTLDSFIHKPENWQETTIDKIKGWNLKELLGLKQS